MQEGAEGSSVIEAFDLANKWIQQAIEALVVLLLKKGVINQDLNALRSVFCDFGGRAFYGVAAGSGADYVANALEQLIQCPLLHLNQDPYDADQLILHIQAGQDCPWLQSMSWSRLLVAISGFLKRLQ